MNRVLSSRNVYIGSCLINVHKYHSNCNQPSSTKHILERLSRASSLRFNVR